MKITNIRLGHATNSSSSHSIVLNAKSNEVDSFGLYEFGWDHFVLTSIEAKIRYLAATFYCNIGYEMGFEYAKHIVNGIFGNKLPKAINNIGDEPHIDHQSVLSLPRNYEDQSQVDLRFLDELTTYIINKENLSIIGGNDNSEPFDAGGSGVPIIGGIWDKIQGGERLICRKDGDFWILYNKYYGGKIRFSFCSDDNYVSASTPELIDLKITDFCNYGCRYCYQDSNIFGQHANLKYIQSIIYSLTHLKVFEIAIGGGEPTIHPNFAEILKDSHKEGITPNFSTRNLKWVKNKEIRNAVKEYCGGFAYSISGGGGELNEAISEFKKYNINKYSFQAIPELMDYDSDIFSLIDECGKRYKPLTLLGFKPHGRAINMKPKKINMFKILESAKNANIFLSIDTKLAEDYKDEIEKFGIHRRLICNSEGSFSMYVDAVENFIAKDSYSDNKIKFEKYELNKAIEANFPFV